MLAINFHIETKFYNLAHDFTRKFKVSNFLCILVTYFVP